MSNWNNDAFAGKAADAWGSSSDFNSGANKNSNGDDWNSNDNSAGEKWNSGDAGDGDDSNWASNNNADGNYQAQDFGNGFGSGNQDDGAGPRDVTCRNCQQEGHFSKDCPEPRKMGACFNCGQEGHSKADCTNPRVFTGECRSCGKAGHPAAECPERVVKCKQCLENGHEAVNCTNLKKLDYSDVPDMTVEEAWKAIREASDERDITDFKDGLRALAKAAPEMSYSDIERSLRKRNMKIYLIGVEQEIGDTWTNVSLQGVIDMKYTVTFRLSKDPQRPNEVEGWPQSVEENLARLDDAGLSMDRGIPKCRNCDEMGHMARKCPQEKMIREQAGIKCALCDEPGHRVRDCPQERKKPGRACRVCEGTDHMAKDCPNREKRTCKNCGSEDHMVKECDQPRPCRNCDERGHEARDCPQPRNWDRVKCRRCGEMGHGVKRCKLPAPEEEEGDNNGGMDNGFGDAAPKGVSSGDWDTPAPISSAQADWEKPDHTANSAPAGIAGGW